MKEKRWYPFIMLGCAVMVNFAYLGMVSNVIGLYTPSILEEFPEFSRSSFTLTLTLLNLMAALGNILHTPVRKRVTLRGMLTLGWGLAIVGLGIYSMAESLLMFYLGGGMIGLACGFCGTGSATLMVNTWFVKRKGTFVSVAMAGIGLGVTVISPVISHLITGEGWRVAFRTIMFMVAVLGLVVVLVYRNAPVEEEKKAGQARVRLHKSPEYLAFLVLAFLMAIVLYAMMANISVIAADMGYSIIEIGYFSSVAFALNLIAQLPVGIGCDRFGSSGILRVVFCIMAVLYLVFFVMGRLPLALMLVVSGIFGCAKSILNNVSVYIVQEIAPEEERGHMVSLCVAMSSLGAASGIYVVQLGYDLLGSYQGVYGLFIVLALVCLLLDRYLGKCKR